MSVKSSVKPTARPRTLEPTPVPASPMKTPAPTQAEFPWMRVIAGLATVGIIDGTLFYVVNRKNN